jgi:HPt (histidine-containing phosphotransfer) domain-containing protein
METSANHQRCGEHLDAAALSRLRGDIGDAALRRFARSYTEQLTERLDRIGRALSVDDNTRARTAATDLATGSATVGARRVAELAHDLEGLVSSVPVVEASLLLHLAREEAAAVSAELRQVLGLDDDPTHGEPNR